MKTKPISATGFSLVEIMVVIAIIGLLAATTFPSYVRARNQAQRNGCLDNLRLISAAKHQWALENKKLDSTTPTSADIQIYLQNNLFPQCPADGVYTIGAVNSEATCSRPRHSPSAP
jgi:prepilin-type N-terminal cleavage/methylation domain-containing protein